MTRERAAELLSGVKVLDDPEMEEDHKMAISAIRQQETVTKCHDLYDEDGGEIYQEKDSICSSTNLPCCRCNPGPCEHRKEPVTNRNGLIDPVENRCEYCNDPHPARDCIVDGNLEQMLVGRSFSDAYIQTRRIKFCPMCGRDLLPEEGAV